MGKKAHKKPKKPKDQANKLKKPKNKTTKPEKIWTNQQNPNKNPTTIQCFPNPLLPTTKIQLESKILFQSDHFPELTYWRAAKAPDQCREGSRRCSWEQGSSDRTWLMQPWDCRTWNTEQGGCYFFPRAAEFILILLQTEDCKSQRILVESLTTSLPVHIYYFNASKWNFKISSDVKKPDVPDCSSNFSLSKNVF